LQEKDEISMADLTKITGGKVTFGLTVCPKQFESKRADGKSRRVKSGIRLLAHGVLARASKLRAYGNAIDLRPAAAFIEAALACRP
jgi:hypothetical protein